MHKPTTIIRFDSLGEFLDKICNSPINSNKKSSTRVEVWEGDDIENIWEGSRTFEEAVTIARIGWERKASELQRLSAPIVEKITSLVERSDINYDVEGTQVDIARFVDGEPECWQYWTQTYHESTGTKHLRIVFNCMISAGITNDVIIAKGAAIASLIEALEFAGHRVQLDVAIGYKNFEAYVTVKKHDQPLDMPRIAFALASPAMARRFMFRLLETQPRDLANAVIGYGYGGNHKEYYWRVDNSDQGDLYFGHSFLGEPAWTNPESTTAWILAELKKQGVTLTDTRG